MRSHITFSACLMLAIALVFTDSASVHAQRPSYGRNDRAVLTPFREVVASTRQSTARIMSENKQVAMGAIVAADGWIVTKASELVEPLEVHLADGTRLPAKIVGTDQEFDIALLRIDAENLVPVKWRTADTMLPGSWLAVPGVDEDPVAIGVVSVIPREILPQAGVLGIMLDEGEGGPFIAEVIADSSAEAAGLLVNDQVLAVNGSRTETREELVGSVRGFSPGVKIELTILRGEEEMQVEATLGHRPADPDHDRGAYQDSLGGRLSNRRAGFPEVFQHDCVLRPRECGGPIVDLSGEVVGINIARAGRVKSYAVPAEEVREIILRLRETTAPAEDAEEEDLQAEGPHLAELLRHLREQQRMIGEVNDLLDDLGDEIEDAQESLQDMQQRRAFAQGQLQQMESALDRFERELEELQQ